MKRGFMKNFAEKLHHMRKYHSLSLDKLSEISGISKGHLWELENEKSTNPSFDKVIRLCEALRMPLDWFAYGDLYSPPESELEREFINKFNRQPRELKDYIIQMAEVSFSYFKDKSNDG